MYRQWNEKKAKMVQVQAQRKVPLHDHPLKIEGIKNLNQVRVTRNQIKEDPNHQTIQATLV